MVIASTDVNVKSCSGKMYKEISTLWFIQYDASTRLKFFYRYQSSNSYIAFLINPLCLFFHKLFPIFSSF